MYYFDAPSRDGFDKRSTCNTCCEEYADAVPGETNKWRIGYADWLAGINGRALIGAEFSFVKLTPDPAPLYPDRTPPTNQDYVVQIQANASYSGTVATHASGFISAVLTFALDPVNPPQHGIVAMNSDGSYIYVPSPGYVGIDTFTFVTMDSVNAPVKNSVTFGVDAIVGSPFQGSLPPQVVIADGTDGQQVYETVLPPSQGLIFVDPRTVRLNNAFLDFALTVAPETLVNQIYRMTIAVSALECGRQTYRNISSYDVRISSCGLP